MATKTTSKLFDLTAVIELQQSLSLYPPVPGKYNVSSQDFASGKDPPSNNDNGIQTTDPSNLGDFSKLFQVLGMAPLTDVDPSTYRLKVDYASDGVVNDKTSSKGKKVVKWPDYLTDPDNTDVPWPEPPPGLTKAQRKGWNARMRTEVARERIKRKNSRQAGTVSETEADPVRRSSTPAGRAAEHSQEGYLCDSPSALNAALKRMDEKRAEISSSSPRTPQGPSTRRHWEVLPLLARSDAEREMALLLKLVQRFPEDHQWLVHSKTAALTESPNPQGAHIFIDASNIFIGFEEALKKARGIPSGVRIPNLNLSFEALSFLLERKRPVAKRVLVGSNPRLPAHDKAEELGYECHLLEKVYKLKPLSDRQKYFATRHGGSAQEEKPRFHEQGVDELLHLKMLESLLDHNDAEQQGTMVLATGDGAEAEYSDGFLRYVKTALSRGWKVELVSWKNNIHHAYLELSRQQEFRKTFRIIYLDHFAEELLRTQSPAQDSRWKDWYPTDVRTDVSIIRE